MSFTFVKGHGTRNDFVVLPDLDGSIHGDLDPELVRRLCDRRGGIGADGVLRVLRGDVDGGAAWFMDYRNADGSTAQICGNGVRVFAEYLRRTGLVRPDPAGEPLAVDTRDGIKLVSFCDDGELSVDMGKPAYGEPDAVSISVDGREYTGRSVDMGNPHAVIFVSDLGDVGSLTRPPITCAEDFPEGANVEFVRHQGDRNLAVRVHERGVGETESCGTGACAATVTAALADQVELPATYDVNLPGGRLTATWDGDHVHLKGPAVLVAEGTWRHH